MIAAIGCLLIYSATYFDDPGLGIFTKQLLWLAIGLVLMLLFLFVDYHVFFDIAPILYGIGIVLLLYLLVFGQPDREREVVDSHRRRFSFSRRSS